MRYLISIIVDDPKIESYDTDQATLVYTDVTYKVGDSTLTLELAAASPSVSITPVREYQS